MNVINSLISIDSAVSPSSGFVVNFQSCNGLNTSQDINEDEIILYKVVHLVMIYHVQMHLLHLYIILEMNVMDQLH